MGQNTARKSGREGVGPIVGRWVGLGRVELGAGYLVTRVEYRYRWVEWRELGGDESKSGAYASMLLYSIR